MPIKRDYEMKECAIYNILGIRVDGCKEILGLEEGTKAIFPEVVVLHCPPDSQLAKVRPDARLQGLHRSFEKIYGASSIKACRVEFECLCQVWTKYPGAIAVWKRCFAYVKQLFEFPSVIRKIMYTTNAIEAVNSSFRKVTKRGAFPNYNSLFKLLYLRVFEL